MQTLVQYDIGMTQAKKPVLFKDRLSSQWVFWNSLLDSYTINPGVFFLIPFFRPVLCW
jgi:hypothetical protein